MVEANDRQKSAECYVKIYFGGGKGAALEIWKVWWGKRRQGCRGVRIWSREKWVSGCWDGYR